MAKAILGAGAIKVIHNSVETLFDRLKRRFLGSQGKQIMFAQGQAPQFSLNGLYDFASKIETGQTPSQSSFSPIKSIVEEYLDAHKASAKAQIVRTVQSSLEDTDSTIEDVLEKELSDVFYKTFDGVKKVIKTEANVTKNYSILDSIKQINIENEVSDPVVFWLCVHDSALCPECKRLHLLDNETTPRVWLLSECASGYVKRGSSVPSLTNLHPLDRCVISTLTPGYGFNSAGHVEYIGPNHNELKKQREGKG